LLEKVLEAVAGLLKQRCAACQTFCLVTFSLLLLLHQQYSGFATVETQKELHL